MKGAKPLGNRLLDSLPASDGRRLEPYLVPYAMHTGEELHQRAGQSPYVFFPIDSVSSLVVSLADGTTIEVASVGHEGMVGLPLFIESETVVMDSFTQVPGRALRMERRVLRAELRREEALCHRLHEYTEALLLFIAQSAACNQAHGQRERCARWLLHVRDRVSSDRFPLTQEFLSQMLGVRRPTVTAVAGELREKGLIDYKKGSVRVVDRRGLEEAACDCYQVIRREHRRLFGGPARPVSSR
jgi:CRP-like cAMP-binding protein